jgi:hypothetical protein
LLRLTGSELKTIKELMEKDLNIYASAMAIRYNEVIRNLTYMVVSPEKVELSSEEATGYLVIILLYVLKKIGSDPSAPEAIRKTLGEIEKHVSDLMPYGLKTRREIEERSRQRGVLGQQPSG